MSERVPVRRLTATVTVTREIVVVLPIGVSDETAVKIIRESDLKEFTDGQEGTVRIDEVVKTGMVDPVDEDLFVVDQFGAMKSTWYSDWTKPENIGKYLVKS